MTATMRYSAAASRNLSDDGVRRLVASYTGKYAAVIPDFKMQPGMIYTQVRAISARINQNYDAWPSGELKKSFRTFLGKPVFVNHQNFDPEKARGRVVAARYRENGNDKYIEVIQEIDAVRFPKLAKEIHEGGLDSVSMGVEAGFTKCSVCDNTATDISDMCDHVKHHKGETLRHAKTGEPTLVYENCLVTGTLVTMGDGTTRPIESIRVGDFVLDHLGTPRTVIQTMNRQVNEDTIRIYRQNNQTQAPQMTGNHPVLAIRGSAFGKDTFTRQGRLDRGLRPEFIEARELQVGDWVCETHPTTDSSLVKILTADYTRQTRQHETCFMPVHTLPDTLELTEDLGRFIGLFLAEGSVNKGLTQADFAFHRDETHLADFVDQIARQVLGLTSITHKERNGGLTVTIFSSPLAQMLSHFGVGAANKMLPDEFMSAPIDFLRGVVTGHEQGDGLHGAEFVQRHGHKHFTASPRLAEQIYTIHVMLGNTPYHSTRQTRSDYIYPGKSPATWLPMHTVGFGGEGQKKVGRLSFGPWTFVRVKDIEVLPYSGLVYNLEVADTHTYVAEGVAVHNCYKLGFFELSYVFDPADETAVVSRVVVANNKTAKPRIYTYPDRENRPNYYVEVRPESQPEPPSISEKPGLLDQLSDKILDDLERDEKIRKMREILKKYPQDQFLTASAASQIDWADLGRQAYENGESGDPEDDPDLAHILQELDPEDADFAISRYEQGYDMAQRRHSRVAADTTDMRKRPDDNVSTMQNLTPGDMAGMPSAPTQYEMIPGAGPGIPYANGGGGSSSSGSSSRGGGGSSSGGNSARDFAHSMMPQWESQGFTVGDHEADQYGEHQNGALDVMVPDIESGNKVLQQALQDPNVHGLIWNNQAYGYGQGADPRPYSGGNTGNPTQDHMDHVHIWYQPGGQNNIMRAANRRYSWGEIEAPEDIDTLRDEAEDDGSDDFHHYVESPEELRTPDFDQAKRLDRAQESAGLDADRRVEDVEEVGIPTRKGGRRMPRYAEDMGGGQPPMDPSMMGGMDPSMMGQPAMDPNLGQMGPEEELALLNQAQGDLDYAEAELYGGGAPADYDEDGGDEDWDYDDQGQPYDDDEGQPDGDGDEDDEESADPTSIPPQIEARRRGPVRNTSSQKKVRRTQKGRSMGINLSERGKVASRGRRRHADDSGHVDGGPYGRNDQGEQEEIFLSQTPAEEALANPNAGDSISNTENTLVARVRRGTDQLRRDAAALAYLRQQKAARRRYAEDQSGGPLDYSGGDHTDHMNVDPAAGGDHMDHTHVGRRFHADDNIIEPTTVNPDLSGTDDQSLKGDNFDSIALDNVATQPKDASIHAFAAFDDWLARTTGKTARQHGNANFIRRQAARYIRATGVPLGNLFPTLEKVLVEARKAESTTNRRANMDRIANESLETAAPGDRIDVEAPVKNVTDADAQASQYNLSDYGGNASDNLAKPDLSTDSQFWAPGGGEKTSNRTADAVAAVRCAEAYINAGLAPASEKWNLIARFQTMRHATVVDRTRLLEAKNEVDRSAASRQRSAAVSRGTSIPRGLGGQRTAQTNRIAANDPSSDSLLFFK